MSICFETGWRKPLPVLVRINGDSAIAWRTNMMPDGNGNFYLYLHGNMRKASGTRVGDRVRVEIEFDAAYRNGPHDPMPTWFQQALNGNAQAKKNWSALIPSRKKEVLRYLSRLGLRGGAQPESGPGPACTFRSSRAIHGARLEKRIIDVPFPLTA